MLSIIVPARNGRVWTANCLSSLDYTFQRLGKEFEVEYILVDDNSDPQHHIADLFQQFKRQIPAPVTIIRFKQRRYYGWSCAHGFARAKGAAVLLLSYDMAITPDYVRSILQVAGLDETYGIVRGTAQYVDCFPQYQIAPPLPIRNLPDLENFSAYIARYHGLAHAQDLILTGDAFLIKRSVFQKIGSFDTRFPFGYFSDVDFGLRAMRAGFKMVCAKGAWLHHEGAGSYKDEAAVRNIDSDTITAERMQKVAACYEVFRDKWDKSMPGVYGNATDLSFPNLRQMPDIPFDIHQPFVPLDDPLVEIL